MRRLAHRSVILIGALALSGCASIATPPAPTTTFGAVNAAKVSEMVACLESEGWDVQIAPSGAIEYDTPAEQIDAFRDAQEACLAKIGAPETVRLTEAQLSDIYEYESWLAGCLREQGADIPQMPSEQEFEERYPTDDPWFSYSFLGEVPEDTFQEYVAACPQL